MTELDLQKFTATLLRFNAAPKVIWFAVPNGEARSPRTGAKLKAMGVRAGVADLVIVIPGGQVLFLELKTKAGTLSIAQRQFRDECRLNGAVYAIARTSAEVESILKIWGAIRGEPAKLAKAA